MWAFIDKEPDNGDGACDIQDATSVETVGQDHTFAVCLGNVPDTVEAFRFIVTFNADLDECIASEECGEGDDCLDSNPDFIETTLGDDWDCTIQGEPFCGEAAQLATANGDDEIENEGRAVMWCQRDEDDGGGGGFTDHIALAAVNLKVIAAGVDKVTFEDLGVQGDGFAATCEGMLKDVNADSIMEVGIPCEGATDTKQSGEIIRHKTRTPTPEATDTEEPTVPAPSATPALPTPTPLGGGVGPQLLPPETGSGSTGGGFPWTLALLAGVAGAAALAGGLYLNYGWARRSR